MPDDEVVTCFRDGVVTLRRNRRLEGFTEAIKEAGYQHVEPGDLVIHIMDAFCGAIGVSDSRGKCTPVYSICLPLADVSVHYYSRLIREMARSQWIAALGKGIRERSSDFRFEVFASQILPIPTRHEQDAISQYLDRFDSVFRQLFRELSRLDGSSVNSSRQDAALITEYRTRLISDVVTGKLDVREAAANLPEEFEDLPMDQEQEDEENEDLVDEEPTEDEE